MVASKKRPPQDSTEEGYAQDQSDDGDDAAYELELANKARRSYTEAQPERSKSGRKKKKSGSSGGFQSMGLSYPVFKGILQKGYKVPTPIQRKTIPLILDGKDAVAMARTGSGKTAAFVIPLLERLKAHSAKIGIRGIIISPTRELALQTLKFCKELGKHTNLRHCLIVGGDTMDSQFADIHANPDVVIATPGRLLHVVVEMELDMKTVEYLVFDEADRLFEMGFSEQLNELLARIPTERQTLLFSATLPKLLVEFARAGLRDPTLIRLDVDTKISENLEMQYFAVRRTDKVSLLIHTLQHIIGTEKQTVIFVATRHHVDFLHEYLGARGIESTYTYGSLDPAARKINVAKFRAQQVNVLIVTDVAARGIDIPLLDYVINFDFPPKPKLFVHRVGRVARAGRSGTAYSFVAPDEVPYLLDLHLFLGRGLNMASQPGTEDNDDLQDGTLGCAPQALLDDEREAMMPIIKMTHGLESAMGVMLNAYKMYDTTRPPASAQSCERAKEIERDQHEYHPLLAKNIDKTELVRQDFVRGIANYRPQNTIFEQGKNTIDPHRKMMESKRVKHGGVIEHHLKKLALAKAKKQSESIPRRKVEAGEGGAEVANEDLVSETFGKKVIAPGRNKEGLPATSFAREVTTEGIIDFESQPKIAYRPSDEHESKHLAVSFEQQANVVTFDMEGDDSKSMQRNKSRMKWDRKKKKYIQEDGGNTEKRIKTENGNLIKASFKSGVYNDWASKNKVDRQLIGAEEAESNRFVVGAHRKRGKYGQHGGSESKSVNEETAAPKKFGKHDKPMKKAFAKGTGAFGPSGELKSKGEILRARKEKEKKMEKQHGKGGRSNSNPPPAKKNWAPKRGANMKNGGGKQKSGSLRSGGSGFQKGGKTGKGKKKK